MTNIELVLNMLAEVTTTAMSKEQKPKTMAGHKQVQDKVAKLQKLQKLPTKKELAKRQFLH